MEGSEEAIPDVGSRWSVSPRRRIVIEVIPRAREAEPGAPVVRDRFKASSQGHAQKQYSNEKRDRSSSGQGTPAWCQWLCLRTRGRCPGLQSSVSLGHCPGLRAPSLASWMAGVGRNVCEGGGQEFSRYWPAAVVRATVRPPFSIRSFHRALRGGTGKAARLAPRKAANRTRS